MEFEDKSILFELKELKNLKNFELVFNALNAVEMHRMINPGDSVLISVSGGPDSVCLLYFFNIIKNKYKLNLFAFHLDHLTREGESTKDAGFVKNLCLKLNIPLYSEKINVKNWCLERKLNFQDGARLLRKKLLEEYRIKNSINKIAVAHNADDNIETFMMNLIRGSGLKGLASMKPVSEVIIRPLIYCFKDEITYFLISNGFDYCVDATNFESKYFRNKIRNKLIPYIENELGQQFKNNILNTINILRSGSDYIEDKVLEIIDGLKKRKDSSITNAFEKGFVRIYAADVENLDVNLKAFLIQKLIELVKGSSKDIISANVADILKLCHPGGESKKINLTAGLIFVREGDFLYIYDSRKIGQKDLFIDSTEDLPTLTSTEISEDEIKSLSASLSGKKLITETLNESGTNDLAGEISKKIIDSDFNLKIKIINASGYFKNQIKQANENEAYLDLDKIKFPVLIRKWRHGDKFMPFGMNYKKKLQDFFIDNRIPLHSRNSVPIFCDLEKIIWIGGQRIDERVKIEENTRNILYLLLEKNSL